ncbi:MAG: DEAD/DEAH box helicase [Clostridiales bacterium]|nr:DEAD/DEAH box helicase [Clostridiales bacterium]
MIELISRLNMNKSLADALAAEGITTPTEIQAGVLPEAVLNRDIIAQSETGTGKTLSYLLPVFNKLDASKKEIQVFILVPSHELAVQVQRQIEKLVANSDIKATSAVVIGNVNIDRQVEKVKEKPNIVVGTPGRILELIGKKKLQAHNVKTIVIDEGDRLLDDSNRASVQAIIKSTLKERQLMLFSATIKPETEALAKTMMKDPAVIRARAASIPEGIEHICFFAEYRQKLEVLRKLIRLLEPEKSIIFVHRREDAEIYNEKLNYHGIPSGSLQGMSMKSDRKKVMDDFRNGKIRCLIASDLAARGLDIKDVTHIFNLNLPEEAGEYLHRAGRTGRSGKTGTVISIVTAQEYKVLKRFEGTLKIKVTDRKMSRGEIIDC